MSEPAGWSWYAVAYERLRTHLREDHTDKWSHIEDELRMFEDEFVYGEFKNGADHEVSCPWCDCDFKMKFKTYVKMVIE
jgi:hypothetical protein